MFWSVAPDCFPETQPLHIFKQHIQSDTPEYILNGLRY